MNPTPETRMSLLERVRDPANHEAWQEFVTIYEPLIYRLARRRGLQDADAREVCQDALVAVAGAIQRWEPTAGKGSFRSWLFQIARNLALNLLVKQRRDIRGTGDSNMLQLLGAQSSAAASASAVFEEEYRRQLFRTAAEKIRSTFQAKTWQAFWRSCVDGESIKHVAADLSMSMGSVYAARSRVTAKLTAQLREFESLEAQETACLNPAKDEYGIG